MHDEERRRGARHVLARDVNRHRTLVIDGVSFDDQRLRIIGIDRAEDVAGYARAVEFTALRIHEELPHLPLWNAGNYVQLGRRHVVGADQKIPIGIGGRIHAQRGAPFAGFRADRGQPWRAGGCRQTGRRLRGYRRWRAGAEGVNRNGDGGRAGDDQNNGERRRLFHAAGFQEPAAK